MAIRLPAYLFRNRVGNFCFRRVVPPDLRQYFVRHALYRSLVTADRATAISVSGALGLLVEAVFNQLRRDMPKKPEELLSVEWIMNCNLPDGSLFHFEGETAQDVETAKALLDHAMKPHALRASPANRSLSAENSAKLTDLLGVYLKEYAQGDLREKSLDEYRGNLK